MTIRLYATQSPGTAGRIEFNLCLRVRTEQVAEALDLGAQAERLGFPRIGASALDLALTIQADAPVISYLPEIQALRGLISHADSQWRRASFEATRDRTGPVDPAAFDVVPERAVPAPTA